ncbi:MAG: NADH:flavin oxidoreductase [Hyphomicrobiales bacterium]
MGALDPLFEPLTIRRKTIRNRFLSTSHAPGYADGGDITDRYVAYEREKARGGVGLVQFGGATAVSIENSFHYGQINGAVDAVIPQYRKIAAAIHGEGALCTVQLTHGGRRERWDSINWLPTYSPSPLRELSHRSFPVAMEDHDIARIIADYADSVARAQEGYLDGVEISTQAGTLIEQFWSPAMNTRTDDYGGSLENRMRFGLEVLAACRKRVGDDFILGIRMPGDEFLKGGLTQDDCVAIARAYAASGLIDFISVVGGNAIDYQAIARIWPTMWVPSAAYLPLAGAIRQAAKEAGTGVAVFHATRITDAATAVHAVKEGFVDMVGMTRAFLADPHHVRKLREGREAEIRPCVGAGYCVDRVIAGKDALCSHNVATGRELQLPQVIGRAEGPRKRVTVVGGGPGGLEAARVLATRGHSVRLYEATGELGGQVNLASRGTWRRDLSGITRWLAQEMGRLGVDVRYNTLAGPDEALDGSPDVVIVATGGVPKVGDFEGTDLATTVWDVLAGDIAPKEALVLDESGDHGPLIASQVLAKKGAKVELVTPDRAVGMELPETNLGAHLTELHKAGVTITADTKLVAVTRAGNRLKATLENAFSGKQSERVVDLVVGDNATLPNDDLYHALKPGSRNLGEVDLHALVEARAQGIEKNPAGAYALYRIGDAWTSRNIHAAMLDAMRLTVAM